ncbi:hypothetical protein BC938DRAFT_480662 [Jimgerdemannia flammicorona]|uniref:Uncharacterized protein n=1 Tax=Jimgerdemannia flammicorona TaxID=994334 RepID=A0A433QX63_9FUNG|nr:hypothetical protein BC938DRAFT_480662 [Jimgerdemannia flammicorona]
MALEKKMDVSKKEKELLIERTMLQHAELLHITTQEAGKQSHILQKGITRAVRKRCRDEDAEIPVNAIERNRGSIGFDADNTVERREGLEGQEQFDVVECDMELGTSLTSKESTPSWIHEACSAVEEIRKLTNGVESPMWWRILDLRPETDRVGVANKRAKEYLKPDTLKRLVPPRLALQQGIADERTIMVLNILQSMPSSKMIAQFRKFPVIGTYGISGCVLNQE